MYFLSLKDLPIAFLEEKKIQPLPFLPFYETHLLFASLAYILRLGPTLRRSLAAQCNWQTGR